MQKVKLKVIGGEEFVVRESVSLAMCFPYRYPFYSLERKCAPFFLRRTVSNSIRPSFRIDGSGIHGIITLSLT